MDTSPRARPDEPQAFCSGCGLALEESDALPYESRKPCPNCGGLARTFPASSKIAISSELRASGTLIHVLDSASKYYSEILKPEHDEFFAARSTLRSRSIWLQISFTSMSGCSIATGCNWRPILEKH